MTFDEIVETVAKRESTIELSRSAGFPVPAHSDPDRRKRIESMVEKGNADGELLRAAIGRVEAVESRIKSAWRSLTDRERATARHDAQQAIIDHVEAAKTKQIAELMKKLDSRQAKNRDPLARRNQPEYRSAKLHELELRLRHTSEADALASMPRFERTGYDPLELLVLGAISPKTAERAEAVRAQIPEDLADSESVELLRELEATAELGIGEVSYSVGGTQHRERLHVAALLADFDSPVTVDFAIA
jgi:hypothetical protein